MNDSNIKIDKDQDILQKVDFIKDSWKFVPKHLIAIRNQQKKITLKGLKRKLKHQDPTYQQSTFQIINKNKNLYLTPVRDIQKIMKHFHKKFQQNTTLTHQYENIALNNKKKQHHQNNKYSLNKRIKTTVQIRSSNSNPYINDEFSIENKITQLLKLPKIKRAKSQAQKLRLIEIEQENKKSFQKQQILRKFNLYFSKEINLINTKNQQTISVQNSNDTNLRKLRAKTSVD